MYTAEAVRRLSLSYRGIPMSFVTHFILKFTVIESDRCRALGRQFVCYFIRALCIFCNWVDKVLEICVDGSLEVKLWY